MSIIGTFDATFQFICRQWAFLSKQYLILIPVNKGDDRNTQLLSTSRICESGWSSGLFCSEFPG